MKKALLMATAFAGLAAMSTSMPQVTFKKGGSKKSPITPKQLKARKRAKANKRKR